MMVAVVMVLQRIEGCSDREAADRFCFDARWKYAAGGLDFDYPEFAHTVLVDMRARLARSQRPGRIFEVALDATRQAGLVGRRRVLDSTPLYDAVATMDTVTLVRSAIRGLLKAAGGGGDAGGGAAGRRDRPGPGGRPGRGVPDRPPGRAGPGAVDGGPVGPPDRFCATRRPAWPGQRPGEPSGSSSVSASPSWACIVSGVRAARSTRRHRGPCVRRDDRGRHHTRERVQWKPRILRAAGTELDSLHRTVTRHGRQVDISVKEFAVLQTLMKAAPATLSAEDLLARAWDENIDPFTKTVQVTISRLRRKLGAPPPIQTIPGAGYRITDPAAQLAQTGPRPAPAPDPAHQLPAPPPRTTSCPRATTQGPTIPPAASRPLRAEQLAAPRRHRLGLRRTYPAEAHIFAAPERAFPIRLSASARAWVLRCEGCGTPRTGRTGADG